MSREVTATVMDTSQMDLVVDSSRLVDKEVLASHMEPATVVTSTLTPSTSSSMKSKTWRMATTRANGRSETETLSRANTLRMKLMAPKESLSTTPMANQDSTQSSKRSPQYRRRLRTGWIRSRWIPINGKRNVIKTGCKTDEKTVHNDL